MIADLKRHPGLGLMVAGGVAFLAGLFVSPRFKHFERVAILAAVLGAGAEAFRMWKT